MTVKILGIAGNSGAGKTTLIEEAIRKFPDTFYRGEQMTTRKPRANEIGHYNFVSDQFYTISLESNMLTAVTEFDDAKYGSIIPTFSSDKINLLALNTEGLCSLITDSKESNFTVASLGLVKESPSEKELEGRNHRNIQDELDFLPLCEYVVNLEAGEYYSAEDLYQLVMTRNLLNKLR